jgi:hypothetical protein
VKLPFTATLREFQMERFDPTLAVAKLDKKAEDGVAVTNGSQLAKAGAKERVGGYDLEILRYLPQAAFTGETWQEYRTKTSAPAVLVRVTKDGKPVKEGWVSCGGLETPSVMLSLDKETVIAMSEPRPKKFRSEITIEEKGVERKASVEVNRPIGMGSVSLYQLSYDEKMGPASEYSVLEVVNDRSIPVVWGGMLAMLAGVAMMMWQGVGTNARRLK